MIFKIRPKITKQFDEIHNFGFKNLIVTGCSFVYNNHDSSAVTWPYYLRDMGGFDNVLDTSMPAAGNYHIANSLQWAIEMDRPNVDNSLIIVMWSGNDRDDYICPITNLTTSSLQFNYDNYVATGVTGGSADNNTGNTKQGLKILAQTKTHKSRAIENYLYISGLWSFLTAAGYKFLFLNYMNRNLPNRTKDFDITKFLEKPLQKKFNSMMLNVTDPYTYALKNNLLLTDDFHPSPDGHLAWTRDILLPQLQLLNL